MRILALEIPAANAVITLKRMGSRQVFDKTVVGN